MTKRLLILTVLSLVTWKFTSPAVLHVGNKEELIIPSEYEVMDLVRSEMSELEEEFSKNFPGQIETYYNHEGIVIFRQVYGATRKLHDTSTCLLASGFEVSEETLVEDEKGRMWKTYVAMNDKEEFIVKSIILETENGGSWSSVGAWFWQALFQKSDVRYLAITEIMSS